MGVARNRTRYAAGRKKESYVETGTNNNLFYLKYYKVLQDLLKVRRIGNENNKAVVFQAS